MKILIDFIIAILLSIPTVLVGNSISAMEDLQSKLKAEAEKITKTEMSGIDEFFGGDLFEGRAPGTRGGDLAQEYIRSILKFMNIQPLGRKYIQPFILKGFTTKELNLTANDIKLNYKDDIVGGYIGKSDKFNISARAVFIGFGTKTKLWNWDDFKDSDISGKIVIVRVNDPGMFLKDVFEEKILTYFGRWTYHIEEAKKRGALGVLLIHTDESAGYGWKVVKNSWGGEELYLLSDLKGNLKFSGWIKEKSLIRMLRKKKFNLKLLYKKSLQRSFKPIDLGFNINISGVRVSREVKNANVIGLIPGKSKER